MVETIHISIYAGSSDEYEYVSEEDAVYRMQWDGTLHEEWADVC